ncbi:hypothetical protein CDA63_15270 [Hymenobacter amundsenii]|uniref:Uncharacterized protein n=1 Tax=Hymenobacter amundsenii TaxID=2006685 RepID=A0A246FI99_9BACT|nr:hypothetical protein CDA63_15270 [Hymenobacter amundsenii]
MKRPPVRTGPTWASGNPGAGSFQVEHHLIFGRRPWQRGLNAFKQHFPVQVVGQFYVEPAMGFAQGLGQGLGGRRLAVHDERTFGVKSGTLSLVVSAAPRALRPADDKAHPPEMSFVICGTGKGW